MDTVLDMILTQYNALPSWHGKHMKECIKLASAFQRSAMLAPICELLSSLSLQMQCPYSIQYPNCHQVDFPSCRHVVVSAKRRSISILTCPLFAGSPCRSCVIEPAYSPICSMHMNALVLTGHDHRCWTTNGRASILNCSLKMAALADTKLDLPRLQQLYAVRLEQDESSVCSFPVWHSNCQLQVSQKQRGITERTCIASRLHVDRYEKSFTAFPCVADSATPPHAAPGAA